MTYSQKLKDPRWQKKRLEILSRDNFTCTTCGDNETELHIHHNSYMGDPWQTENNQLTTLCSSCHSMSHVENTVVINAIMIPESKMKVYRIIVEGEDGIAIFKKVGIEYGYSTALRVSDLDKIVHFLNK